VKAYLNQVQQCFKLKYHCFAAYYLVCRQVIILIVYINTNYDTTVYCLQTFCIITVTIHVWTQPYKSTVLNMFDGVILLILVLVVNCNSYAFSKSFTMTIVIVMVIFPILFALLVYLIKNWHGFRAICFIKDNGSESTSEVED